MGIKKTALLISLLCISITDSAFAEPSPTVRYLMNEPVSRLDWGIYQLQKELEELNVSVRYNWDENRIEISKSSSETPKDLNQAKILCKEEVSNLKIILGVNPEIGKPYGENSFLWVFFRHEGYKLKSEPETLWEDLDNITRLSVTFRINRVGFVPLEEESTEKLLSCESGLLDTKVLYSE